MDKMSRRTHAAERQTFPYASAANRALRAGGALAVLAAAVVWTQVTSTQQIQPPAQRGLTPVYEGFRKNADGSSDLLFGYYNRSWEEEVDLPAGPANNVEPGGPDRGQPTHFFPRRSQFVFKVRVPADFGDKEVVWTLTSNGASAKAYGTLRPAYAVDDTVMSANFWARGQSNADVTGNQPPTLTIESTKSRVVRVGESLALSAVATDDGKPAVRSIPVALVGQSHFTPNSATGLRLSWFKYRGAGEVVVDPQQTKVWEDRRDGADSPWAVGWNTPPVPAGNRWTARATFGEPGTYVIRTLAHNGGLIDYDDGTVTVTR